MLQARAEDLQRIRALQREMAALRDELLDLASRVSSMESELQDRDELENRIHQVNVSDTFRFEFNDRIQLHVEFKLV
jgi:predicted RNA-binding protein associated with RNAse of E/G family